MGIMMKESVRNDKIEIKKRTPNFVARGLLRLAAALVSLFCACLPFITEFGARYGVYFYVVGFAAFLYFAALYALLLYRGIRPQNALVVTNRGFVEYISNPSAGISVDWTNVQSVKVFGPKKAPLLGIALEDNDIIIERQKKALADELRTNLETGLPALVLPQAQIAQPVVELKKKFDIFIRSARSIDELSKTSEHFPARPVKRPEEPEQAHTVIFETPAAPAQAQPAPSAPPKGPSAAEAAGFAPAERVSQTPASAPARQRGASGPFVPVEEAPEIQSIDELLQTIPSTAHAAPETAYQAETEQLLQELSRSRIKKIEEILRDETPNAAAVAFDPVKPPKAEPDAGAPPAPKPAAPKPDETAGHTRVFEAVEKEPKQPAPAPEAAPFTPSRQGDTSSYPPLIEIFDEDASDSAPSGTLDESFIIHIDDDDD